SRSAARRSRRDRSATDSVPPLRRLPAAHTATPTPRWRAVAASRPPGGSLRGRTIAGTSARTAARTWSSPGSQLSRSSSTSHGPSSENAPSVRSCTATKLEAGDELFDPLVFGLERVLAQDGALRLVVELQVHPVDRVVALALLGPLDEGTPELRPGALRRVGGGVEDVGVGRHPLRQPL